MHDSETLSVAASDLTGCDREPIHIPGTIQPHGVLLVAGIDDLMLRHAAGDVRGFLGADNWLDRPLSDLLGEALTTQAFAIANATPAGGFVNILQRGDMAMDVHAHLSGDYLIVECERTTPGGRPASVTLGLIDGVIARFESAKTLDAICAIAAREFRSLTGYDRVMVYRFLDDDAGVVLAEDRREDMQSFLNHHFPASDIPRQARDLYIRNLVRVIPDASYTPAPIEPPLSSNTALDMSDCHLRSVSPIHLQYLRNMGVAASASVSIVKDGSLWGLIACHHATPRPIGGEVRAACRALAGGLARQIKSREETEAYRERLRLRGSEDDIVALLARKGTLDDALSNHIDEMRRFMSADGVIVVRGSQIITAGNVPDESDARPLCDWLLARSVGRAFSTDRLGQMYKAAQAYQNIASGVLAVALSSEDPWLIVWLRAEVVQVVQWAGAPHKAVELKPGEILSPRASFESWKETVHGRSRRWTPSEIEAAERIRTALIEMRQSRRIRELNKRLSESIDEKDLLLEQKQYLIGEVNHRVQNSLQLVSSFLSMQARGSDNEPFKSAIEEARRRIGAVSLVHRRLYRGDHVGAIDAGRYVSELCDELRSSMDDAWSNEFAVDAAPIMMPTDKAVSLGLILTELVININKYAYDGAPGPISVQLVEDRARFRLIVADKGKGRSSSRKGFGSRMMDALVGQLGGEIDYADNHPGLRATLSAPVDEPSPAG